MSYLASAELQGAVYQHLRADPVLTGLINDAVYDAMPVSPPAGIHVSLGPEDVRGIGDSSGGIAQHDFIISVLDGRDGTSGFPAVKEVAKAVSAALEGGELVAATGRLAGLWFLRARARRVENGIGRRIDMTFRALIDLA